MPKPEEEYFAIADNDNDNDVDGGYYYGCDSHVSRLQFYPVAYTLLCYLIFNTQIETKITQSKNWNSSV